MDQLLDNEAHREHAMTPDPRAVEIAARALEDVQPPESDPTPPDEAFFADARRVLAALEAAGWSLLPPGGQSEIHWAVIGEDADGEWIEYEDDEASARARLARVLAHDPRSAARVVSRIECTGPWRPTDTPEADHG